MNANYYMILNVGTLAHSSILQSYPYQMLLCQQYTDKSQYAETYRQAIKRMAQSGKHQLIMDNGAHEGIDVDLDTYKLVLAEVKPNVAVLPDLVGRSGQESFTLSVSFIDWLEKRLPKTKYMFAAQGKSKTEILDSYQRAMEHLDPSRCVIGLGQSYLTWESESCLQETARFQLMEDLVAQCWSICRNHKFHVLGGRWRSKNLLGCALANHITGLDSVKPLTSVRSHMLYPDHRNGQHKTDLCDTEVIGAIMLSRSIDKFVDAYGLNKIDWAPYFKTESVW